MDDCSIESILLDLRGSSKRDLIAGLVGLLSLPLTYFAFLPNAHLIRTSFLISGALMMLSAIAGFLVALKADWSSLSRLSAFGFASRLGASGGFVVYLAGGGMAVLATTTHILVLGVAPGDMTWNEESMTGIFAVLLCVIPTVTLGSLGSLAGTSFRAPRNVLSESPPTPSKTNPVSSKQHRPGILRWAAAVFALSLLSPIIPSFLASREPETPIVEETTPTFPSLPEETPPPPPVKLFDYTKPERLKTAHASEWTITTHKTIRGFDRRSPAAISPDGHFLAFKGSHDPTSLTVHDLNRHKTARHFGQIPPVRSMTWSPDSKRLFCICRSEHSPFWVLEPETGQTFDLPISRDLLKFAEISWWRSQNEIYFLGDRKQLSRLDLGTLELDVIDAASRWRNTALAPNRIPTEFPEASLPETKTCKVTITPKLDQYLPPPENKSNQWQFHGPAALAALDTETEHIYFLPVPAIDEQTTIIPSPEGSKIIQVTDSNATVYYLGLRERSVTVCDAKFPHKPPSEVGSDFPKFVDNSILCCFVCTPLVNPLNGQVVGPNRQKPKAVLRITFWTGSFASLEVVEQSSPLRTGDILTDIHYWDSGMPILLVGDPFDRWWTPITKTQTVKERRPPGPVPRWNAATLDATMHSIQFQSWDASLPRSVGHTSARRSIDDLTGKATNPAKQREKASSPRILSGIKNFVVSHHKKVTTRSLVSYTNDYATRVDFHDKGMVGQVFIQEDQANYFATYSALSEEVLGDVHIRRIDDRLHQASYSIRSIATRKDNHKQFDRTVKITLDITTDEYGRYRIVRERGQIAK